MTNLLGNPRGLPQGSPIVGDDNAAEGCLRAQREPLFDTVSWRASLVLVALAVSVAANARAAEAPPRTGAEVWDAACAACHGADGGGQPRAVLGFDVPVPDLRDCTFATSEPTPDWVAVVHEGGPVRGLDRMMPAYGGALSDEEIARVVDYARGFCRELPDWPLGDLNLPRALFTEKAFPENEAVLTSTIALRGPGSVMNELIYEKRLGARSMIELAVPFGFLNLANAPSGMAGAAPVGWTAGIGDLGAAFKHAAVHSARAGTILSFGLDVSIPTGRADRGLGAGVMVVGPFVACGQLLPAGGFVQAHAGADLPGDFDTADPEIFWRALLGWSLVPKRFGRMYSPMLEVLGARAFGPRDAVVLWDLAPQIQVTLNRRKHIRLNVGALVPANRTGDRHVQLGTYLLWDFYEGSPLKGW
jgi:mono/diheme cytochrome c family protein